MKGLVAILGSGESGRGAAILAKKVGYEVFVSDSNKISKQTKLLFKKLSIDYEENHHSIDKIIRADKVIKSPGIDKKSDLIVDINKKGIDVISEIEFGFLQTNFVTALLPETLRWLQFARKKSKLSNDKKKLLK